MQALSDRLVRTNERAKDIFMRAKKLSDKAEVEMNLKKIRTGIAKKGG